MIRRLLVIIAASTAALALSGVAAGRLVPQRSVAGVSLTMTRAEVRAVLGAPRHVVRGRNDFGPFTVYRYYRLRITFQGNAGATDLRTSRRSERTRRGIGVGSTVVQVRENVDRVRCGLEAGRRVCRVGRLLPGRRVTEFRFRNGRVIRVEIGFVID